MVSRRTAIALGTTTIMGFQTANRAVARSSPLLQPPRKHPSRLRLSLAAYSLRQYLEHQPGQTPKMDLFEFMEYCHGQGISGVELTSYYFPKVVTKEYLTKLKLHCHRLGMTISSGAIRNDFCQKDASSDLAHTRTWIDHYAFLGAPTIRIFAGESQPDEDLSQTLKRCAANCELACQYAHDRGIILALENHGGVTATAAGLLEIARSVHSPAFGVNFDSGNFQSTDDPYLELEQIAPYAVNAQIKVDMHINGKQLPADLLRIVNILRGAIYSGWVALEYESAAEPLEAIPKWLKQLQLLMDG
jgi:sugar phosphate isomerase/epimerase